MVALVAGFGEMSARPHLRFARAGGASKRNDLATFRRDGHAFYDLKVAVGFVKISQLDDCVWRGQCVSLTTKQAMFERK